MCALCCLVDNFFFQMKKQRNKETHENFLGSQNPASKTIYVKVIHLIDKLSRFANLCILKVTLPCLILPRYVASFYIYFTTDVGNDAFELPLTMWYELIYCIVNHSITILTESEFVDCPGFRLIGKIHGDFY